MKDGRKKESVREKQGEIEKIVCVCECVCVCEREREREAGERGRASIDNEDVMSLGA